MRLTSRDWRSESVATLSSILAFTVLIPLACSNSPPVEDRGTPNGQTIGDLYPPGSDASGWPRFLHYIRSTTYPRLVLEVDQVPGAQADSGALENLRTYLSELLDKPQGVEILLDGELPARGSDHQWTDDELAQLASEHFVGDEDDALHIHLMYVDGGRTSAGGGVTLGLAWGYQSIVVFKESIERTCRGLPLGSLSTCEKAELAILTHELGHVLGLVDNGLPMVEDHRDPNPERGSHDVNSDCIMYWAYNGEAVIDALSNLLGPGQRIEFCPASLADIEAAR